MVYMLNPHPHLFIFMFVCPYVDKLWVYVFDDDLTSCLIVIMALVEMLGELFGCWHEVVVVRLWFILLLLSGAIGADIAIVSGAER